MTTPHETLLALSVPDEWVERIAERAAEIVLNRLEAQSTALAPEWLSVTNAARHLDVTEERIRKLIARRQLPFYQEAPGCRILLRRRELDDWLAAFRQPRNS